MLVSSACGSGALAADAMPGMAKAKAPRFEVSTKIEWQKDSLMPVSDAINNGAGYPRGTETDLAVDNCSIRSAPAR